MANKDNLNKDLEDALKSGAGPKAARFALTCLGGLSPQTYTVTQVN